MSGLPRSSAGKNASILVNTTATGMEIFFFFLTLCSIRSISVMLATTSRGTSSSTLIAASGRLSMARAPGSANGSRMMIRPSQTDRYCRVNAWIRRSCPHPRHRRRTAWWI